MPARFIVAILAGALAAGGVAGGCQIIAQLNDLQVAGTGGAGGGSPTSSSGGACPGDAGMCVVSPCPSCSGNLCELPCSAGMCPSTILTTGGPTAVQCTDTTCANTTFTCASGSTFLCELDCTGTNSCAGTLFLCGDGPCRMRCGPKACGPGMTMVTTIQCGGGPCDVTYFAPMDAGGMPVMQTSCGACGCTHDNLGQ